MLNAWFRTAGQHPSRASRRAETGMKSQCLEATQESRKATARHACVLLYSRVHARHATQAMRRSPCDAGHATQAMRSSERGEDGAALPHTYSLNSRKSRFPPKSVSKKITERGTHYREKSPLCRNRRSVLFWRSSYKKSTKFSESARFCSSCEEQYEMAWVNASQES